MKSKTTVAGKAWNKPEIKKLELAPEDIASTAGTTAPDFVTTAS